MPYEVSKVEVWAGDIPNQPGTLANVLEAVSNAGTNLEFLIARKVDDNTSRVFMAPVKGRSQKAASAAGFAKADGLYGIRIAGPDKPGIGAHLTRAVADAGVNLRGASAAAMGKNAIFYIAVESEADLKTAMKAAKSGLSRPPAPAKKSGKSMKAKTKAGKKKAPAMRKPRGNATREAAGAPMTM